MLPTTTSRKIAEAFSKSHKNVLQDIEKLECSKEFWRLNFQPRKYKDSRGKWQPKYMVTKDGFVMLAMGYTGKRAVQFKEEYIGAFNQMQEIVTKRMYGESATMIDVRKTVPNKSFTSSTKETRVFLYLALKTYLGYSRTSMNGRTRERYKHLMYKDAKGLWVDEDFCVMMIRNRTAMMQRQKTLIATPLLPANFGQLPINF